METQSVNLLWFFYWTEAEWKSGDWYWKFYPDNTVLFRYPHVHAWPIIAISLYIFIIWLIPRVISKPQKWVDKILPAWNCFLWIASVAMLLGGLQGTFHFFKMLNWNFYELICGFEMPTHRHPIVFWTYLFLFSKYVELFDTVWIVLKHPDKPVDLLHWWHHISVLLFSWYASSFRMIAGLIYFDMNALVHSFMYYYYYQMSIGNRPTWSKWLTMGQIAQMIVGTAVNVYWCYLYLMDIPCYGESKGAVLIACALMYGSYFVLFLDFYTKKYHHFSIVSMSRVEKPVPKTKNE